MTFRQLLTPSLVLGVVLTAWPALGADPKPVGETKPAPEAKAAGAGGFPDDYIIGPEDNLQISVWNNEAMSRTVPVRPDGKISLPLINEVQAAGLSPAQLREFLMKRLVEFTPNPEVSVIVTDVRNFKVSVLGEVARAGRYELRSWTTVLDVLALAGGLNQFAARSRIVVLRPNGRSMQRIPFNYNKVISAGGEQENFYLRSGDIVLVP
jgi:polysaccharide export outer membrane protein